MVGDLKGEKAQQAIGVITEAKRKIDDLFQCPGFKQAVRR